MGVAEAAIAVDGQATTGNRDGGNAIHKGQCHTIDVSNA